MSPANDSGGPTAWWGRVFGDNESGGNHTVVVLSDAGTIDPAACARRIGVPDTAFVVAQGTHSVVLRTFSPVEELAQCLQTSLAVLTALNVPEGTPWRVRHERSEEVTVVREGGLGWVCREDAREPEWDRTVWPKFVHLDPDPHVDPTIARQERSRVLLPCADADQLATLHVNADDVLDLCERHGVNGLVLYAPQGASGVRVRVFTTSLSGQEDRATGGAVLAVGEHCALSGTRGDIQVVQGRGEPSEQGHFTLRIRDDRSVLLGGQVSTIMRGRLATYDW